MTQPCMDHIWIAHLVIAVFSGLSSMMTIWLAHRRFQADRERKWFYRQMREKHGLHFKSDHDVGPSGPTSGSS